MGEFGYNTSSCYASAAARQQTVPTAEAEREEQAMASTYSVPLSELVNEFDLNFFYKASDYEKIPRHGRRCKQTGSASGGLFDSLRADADLCLRHGGDGISTKAVSRGADDYFDRFLSYKIPVLMIARGYEPLPECLEMAKNMM